jgi:hypothetical protein
MQALVCCTRRDKSRKRLMASPLSFHSRVMGNGASVSGAGAAFQNALFFWPALGNCAVYFRPTIHHGGS